MCQLALVHKRSHMYCPRWNLWFEDCKMAVVGVEVQDVDRWPNLAPVFVLSRANAKQRAIEKLHGPLPVREGYSGQRFVAAAVVLTQLVKVAVLLGRLCAGTLPVRHGAAYFRQRANGKVRENLRHAWECSCREQPFASANFYLGP